MASSFMPFWRARGWLSRLLSEVVTWQDRTGRWHRLDHVGVACDELQAVSRVEVDQDGVLAVQEREDHRLVTVSMQWSFQRRAAPFPTHASGASFADRPKLRLSAVRDFSEQEWCNTPPTIFAKMITDLTRCSLIVFELI